MTTPKVGATLTRACHLRPTKKYPYYEEHPWRIVKVHSVIEGHCAGCHQTHAITWSAFKELLARQPEETK